MTQKISVEESEKLKELVRTAKDIEKQLEDAGPGTEGAELENGMLDRAKRQVKSYQQYLASKYGGEPENYTGEDEVEVKTAEAQPGESGPEKVNVSGTFEGTGTTNTTTNTTTKTHSPDVANF